MGEEGDARIYSGLQASELRAVLVQRDSEIRELRKVRPQPFRAPHAAASRPSRQPQTCHGAARGGGAQLSIGGEHTTLGLANRVREQDDLIQQLRSLVDESLRVKECARRRAGARRPRRSRPGRLPAPPPSQRDLHPRRPSVPRPHGERGGEGDAPRRPRVVRSPRVLQGARGAPSPPRAHTHPLAACRALLQRPPCLGRQVEAGGGDLQPRLVRGLRGGLSSRRRCDSLPLSLCSQQARGSPGGPPALAEGGEQGALRAGHGGEGCDGVLPAPFSSFPSFHPRPPAPHSSRAAPSAPVPGPDPPARDGVGGQASRDGSCPCPRVPTSLPTLSPLPHRLRTRSRTRRRSLPPKSAHALLALPRPWPSHLTARLRLLARSERLSERLRELELRLEAAESREREGEEEVRRAALCRAPCEAHTSPALPIPRTGPRARAATKPGAQPGAQSAAAQSLSPSRAEQQPSGGAERGQALSRH